MKLFINKLSHNNIILKILSVILISLPPIIYLIITKNLFPIVKTFDKHTVIISKNIITGLNSFILLSVLLISVLLVYKIPPYILLPIIVGILLIASSKLFETLGILLLIMSFTITIWYLTLKKLIDRNERLNE